MASEPILHGREVPLASLRGALDNAFAGRGHAAVIFGEAGIGKTALATAIAREAEVRGAAVTWGRAWEFADAPPYFPVAPCLRALGADTSGEAFELWERVVGALSQAPAPVVWIVEDLHAADLGTLDLLTFLAQPVRAMRVLIVATARERDPRVTDRMLQRLSRMARDGIELRLEPLAEREVAALTEDTLGRAPPQNALRRLVELTGGNPLFVVECARAFRLAGGIEGTLGSLPPTVRQVVLERVALLPDAARAMLASGAVVGREFSAAIVARMADTLPARAIDALLPALRAGVVRETRPGQFLFSHTLVRDAIEDALDPVERAGLHGRAGTALAALGDSSELLVERARHAIAAGADTARELATRAAALLEHERAFDRAFELYMRIDAAGLLGDPATRLHVARVARAAGRADVCRRLCDEVVAHGRAAGDPELLARAALLHLADIRPGVIDRAQVALLDEARAALGDRAPALGCRLLARYATAIQPAPDPAVPIAIAREARARAEATADPALIVDVLELSGWGLSEAPVTERIAWAIELRDRAIAGASLEKAMTGYMWLVLSRIEVGDYATAERELAAMLATADELGHPRHRWRALLIASSHATSAGRFADSDRFTTEVEQLAPLTDDPALALALPLHQMLRALVARRDDEVRARLATLLAVVQPMVQSAVIAAGLRGLCAARIGDLDDARAQLAILTVRLPIAALLTPAFSAHDPVIAFYAELIAAVGSDAERREAQAVLARFASTDVTGGAFTFVHDGPAARVAGLLAASLGDRAGAETQLRAALALARSRDHLPWVAQIACELSRLGGADSTALADESARIARELGMPGLAGAVTAADGAPWRIERSGADWRVSRGAAAITVRDSRGMQLLARLVERPHEEIHVLALASDEGASAPESTAGDLLDDRARKAYRRRLGELADALSDAESRGDARRAAAIERERETLVAELARATGLGGKARAAASTTERARVNVQKRIKEAVARIAEVDAELGRLVERAVRTGTFCCFRP